MRFLAERVGPPSQLRRDHSRAIAPKLACHYTRAEADGGESGIRAVSRRANSRAGLCLKATRDANSRLAGIGGESGIRTHGRVSPTHAFQACSFNHSDISPLWNQTTAVTRWKIANCVRPPNVPRSLTGMRPPLPARMGERFQYKRSLENETSQVPIRRESTVARAFRSTETLRPRHSGWPRDKRVRWRWRASGGALLPIAGHDEFYDEGETYGRLDLLRHGNDDRRRPDGFDVRGSQRR